MLDQVTQEGNLCLTGERGDPGIGEPGPPGEPGGLSDRDRRIILEEVSLSFQPVMKTLRINSPQQKFDTSSYISAIFNFSVTLLLFLCHIVFTEF